MKKRILGLTIFIILICLSKSYAASGDVTMESNNSSAKEGETITITVAAKNEAGLNGIDAKVEYDSNVLELVESTLVDTSNWSEYDSFPQLTAMWKTSGQEAKEADIYKIKFKVKNVGSNKSTTIKLTGITLSLNAADDIKLSDISKTIALTSSSTTSPSTSTKPSTSTSTSPSSSPTTSYSSSPSSSSLPSASTGNGNGSSSSGTGSTSSGGATQGTTTKSTEEIPNTGSNILAIFMKVFLVILTILTVLFYRKYKKYSDI